MENNSVIKRASKSLESTREQGKIAKNDYLRAYEASKDGQPIAWATGYFPSEVVYALDIPLVYPENYACLCAAKGVSVDFCQVTEGQGYSKDLCSYFRTVIGSISKGESVLKHNFPKPDMLLVTTGNCDPHLKWFQHLSEYYDCPLFVLDVPYNKSGSGYQDMEPEYVDYYVKQLRELIAFLEKHSGKTMKMENLEQAVARSDQAGGLWQEILNYRKNVPTPMSAADAFSAIYLLVSDAGTQTAVDFFTKVRDEIKSRVNLGIGVVHAEKFRLFWDWLPMWYNMGLFNYFEEHGAVFPAEYFNLKWACRMDSKKPLESLARKYMSITWGNSPLALKKNIVYKAIKDYQIDGVVLHSNWSCRAYCIGQMDLKNDISKELNIPALLFDSDMADWRCYAEEQLKTRIDAFLELLGVLRHEPSSKIK